MTSITPTKLDEMNNADISALKKSNKDDLLGYISLLRGKIEELHSYKLISERVNLLERSHLRSLQYNRRESIEICGLPEAVEDDQLEEKCLDLLGEIGCGKIKKSSVHACHRLRNRDKTIIRFVNRKHADLALHNKNKLKNIDKEKHGLSGAVYINESLCKPMQFLAYKVRTALRQKKIASYNLWKGKLSVKIENRDYHISHIDDLIDLNLAEDEDKVLVFK